MHEPKSVLLLTRPRESSVEFLGRMRALRGDRFQAVISPVIEIVDHGDLPDLSQVATVVLTSIHAARRLGVAGQLENRRVATVGQATANAAIEFGAKAVALGEDADGLIAQASGLVSPCLHCRGVHTRGDVAARLTAKGIMTDEAVIYEQKNLPLTSLAREALAAEAKVILPVFSPRSAALLASQVSRKKALCVVAISEAAAAAWTGLGEVTIAPAPNADAMAQSVAKLL